MSEEEIENENKSDNDKQEINLKLYNGNKIVEDEIPIPSQRPSYNLFDTIIMYVSTFFEETFLFSILSIGSFLELVLNKPYNFLVNKLEKNDNSVINWLDNNILSNYIKNINSSIKVSGILFIVLSLYILILNIYVLIQSISIYRLEHNVKNIKVILETQEHTLNNFAKIGFNYLVDGNCSILN